MELADSDLVETYRQAALKTADISHPKAQNAAADLVHQCYKKLRGTESGRAAISALMRDRSPHVRGWAAAHSLFWVKEEARAVLEILRDGHGPGSFSAEWTLREFDEGKLSFDY